MTSKHTMKSRISVFMAIKDKLMGFSCGFYGIFIFKQLVVSLLYLELREAPKGQYEDAGSLNTRDNYRLPAGDETGHHTSSSMILTV